MPDQRMLDLTVRDLGGGALELEQRAGSLDEPAVIRLHWAQVRVVAEHAGLEARRLWCLRSISDRLDELRRFYLDEIMEQCGSGIEFALQLRALEDLADELLTGTPSNDNSENISVTQPAPKRGRPATGKALTDAERQARHRAKQAGAPQQNALELATSGSDRSTAEIER